MSTPPPPPGINHYHRQRNDITLHRVISWYPVDGGNVHWSLRSQFVMSAGSYWSFLEARKLLIVPWGSSHLFTFEWLENSKLWYILLNGLLRGSFAVMVACIWTVYCTAVDCIQINNWPHTKRSGKKTQEGSHQTLLTSWISCLSEILTIDN